METIIPAHDQGALSLPASGPEERKVRMAERVARLAVADPEQLVLALHFLIGYEPRVFDAALDAVEPDGAGASDTVEEEPYCVRCGTPVCIFAAQSHTRDLGLIPLAFCGDIAIFLNPVPRNGRWHRVLLFRRGDPMTVVVADAIERVETVVEMVGHLRRVLREHAGRRSND